jgi:peptidoglycan/xylan/chitin deacetylase (PgdA/CDA1 family)
MTGYFLLSIDTELAWGFFDRFEPGRFSADRERDTVSRLLDILDEYHITATWAVVGAMFAAKSEEDTLALTTDWRDEYPAFFELIRDGSALLCGADIVEVLCRRGARHEIAFHGFTHRLFDERTMTEETARSEIEAWLASARPRGITPRSVTFPRSRMGFLRLFHEYGFLCYRNDHLRRGAYSLPVVGRAFRRFEPHLAGLSAPSLYDATIGPAGLVSIPAGRWLFGASRRSERVLDSLHLNHLRLLALMSAVRKAAREKRVIHVYVHPYEFQTEKDYAKLRLLLSRVSLEIQQGTIQSVAMKDLAQIVLAHHDKL